jgi:hypothetical protein
VPAIKLIPKLLSIGSTFFTPDLPFGTYIVCKYILIFWLLKMPPNEIMHSFTIETAVK